MNREDLPAPSEGLLLTHFLTVRDVARSRAFYAEVLGGEVVLEENPCIVKLANSWIIMNPGGGPTPDKPDVSLEPPTEQQTVSAFMNIRVADIRPAYEEWSAKGAEFLTEPIDRKAELRCYMRDPDGYLIEVGQATGLLEGIGSVAHAPPEIDEIVWQQARELHEYHRSRGDEDVVSYYPPEMEAQRDRFAIAYTALDGSTFYVGDHDFAFPLQSISKVFTYAVARGDNGREETLRRVGVEPSGDAFNSFVFDERNHRPFNPMVNAGALVTTNLIHGADRVEKVQRVLERLRAYAANPALEVNEKILAAELNEYSDRNLGLSYLMRSLGMLFGDVLENAAIYLSICSVEVTTRDLATMAATLANGGVNPLSGERALSRACARDVLTVMSMCGMYDAAGEWAYDVGFPAKSGVCGGIMFAIPESFGGAVFSPGLDVHGHSVRGVNVCRDLSERFGLHEYGDPNEERLGLSASEWARVSRPAG